MSGCPHPPRAAFEPLLPPLLLDHSSLTDVDLSRNRLRGELGREVGLLRRVRTLNLRDNRLTSLPPTVAGCSGLVELFLGEAWVWVMGGWGVDTSPN